MVTIDLAAWGFTEHFRLLAAEQPGYTAGRIILQEKDSYKVMHQGGEQLAVVSGRFRHEAAGASDFPAVGDFVLLDPNTLTSGRSAATDKQAKHASGPALIQAVLTRQSAFIRKAAGQATNGQIVAANVDLVFICMSLNNDFNVRRLERYLALAWESGAAPVIVLTKADLCDDLENKENAVAEVAFGTAVLITSSLAEAGIQAIEPYLKPGKTVAFIGSSGVGKSTLINRLLGVDRLATQGLRNDDKGRHTTTHRELLFLPHGGLVIDTPGMRELGMWSADEGLEKAFADIEKLSHACRFKNCTHTNEPGCAVVAALASGTLAEARWHSYQKLQKENAYAENSATYLEAKEKKFKDIAKANKAGRR